MYLQSNNCNMPFLTCASHLPIQGHHLPLGMAFEVSVLGPHLLHVPLNLTHCVYLSGNSFLCPLLRSRSEASWELPSNNIPSLLHPWDMGKVFLVGKVRSPSLCWRHLSDNETHYLPSAEPAGALTRNDNLTPNGAPKSQYQRNVQKITCPKTRRKRLKA